MENIANMKLPNCSLCNVAFSVNGNTTVRLPLLLHCAHPACENCIMSQLRSKTFVNCSICKKVSSLESTLESNAITSQFPIDSYLCGLYFNKSNSLSIQGDEQIGFIKRVIKKKDGSKATSCNECQRQTADVQCKQCNAPYCSPCFQKVHSAARALRDHASTSLKENVSEKNVLDNTTCAEHNSEYIEFYCGPCDKTFCKCCYLASHNGHKVEFLIDKNKECRPEVIESYVSVSNIQRRLAQSKKEIKQTTNLYKKKESSAVEIQVRDHFLKLHGFITLLQHGICKQITSADSLTSLHEVISNLNTNIEDIDSTLKIAKEILNEDVMGRVNYQNLLELLKSKQQIPCYVVKESPDDNIIFETKESIFDHLKEHCSVDIKAKVDYKLLPEDKLPEGYIPEDIEKVTTRDVEAVLSTKKEGEDSSDYNMKDVSNKEDVVSTKGINDSSSLSAGSTSSSVFDLSTVFSGDELVPGCTVNVIIKHLISPSDFYVHRINSSKKLKELQDLLGRWMHNKPTRLIPVSKGGIYMICNPSKNFWFRVRILENTNDNKVNAHYIDFGHTEVVAKDRLRSTPPSVRAMPPLALRCKLANCQPISDNCWDPQAVTVMAQITNLNGTAVINVIEKTSQFYEVNMIKNSDSYSFNVADTLIFLNLAVATNVFTELPVSANSHNMKAMPAKPPLKQDSIIHQAFITHIIDPDHFYILLNQSKIIRKFKDLQNDMQRIYNRGQNNYTMFDPRPGLYVAAKCTIDDQWYRAEVLSIPDFKMVKVFYIDYGNTEIINWKSVKVLLSNYYKIPPQAYRCSLGDIEPLGSEDWNENATVLFRNETANVQVKILVGEVRTDAASIIIYKSQKDADICMNALLVKHQFAISTGTNSTVVEFPKLYQMPKNEDTFQCVVRVDNVDPVPVKLAEKLPQTQLNASDHFIRSSTGCLKLKVNIKRIVDPGEFYITLCYNNEQMSQMKTELQEFYSKCVESEAVTDWKIDTRCATMINNEWYRAIIEDILPDEQFKVYIPDEGITETVKLNNLRVLDERFSSQRDGVIRCHMGGLLPVPSIDSWSQTSNTEFTEFSKTNADNLFITKMTQSEGKDNSLPVELFKRNIIPAGPFEPERDNWVSFNHHLRMMGVAKADSVTKWDVDGSILPSSSDDKLEADKPDSEAQLLRDILSSSFNNNLDKKKEVSYSDTVDIAVKWLPPEPILALEFSGTPTYVDDECNLYIQDFMKSTLTLPQICDDLTRRFNDTLPTQYDLKWTPNDICAAQYNVDKKWYRGIVRKVCNNDVALVEFVDYGNADHIYVENLRKKPSMTHIPIQAMKFKLHTIAPIHADNRWKRQDLNNIHTSVSTKHCRVELEVTADGYGVKRLILSNGVNAIESWVENKWARYAKEPLEEFLKRQNEAVVEEVCEKVTPNVEDDDSEDCSTQVTDVGEEMEDGEFKSPPGSASEDDMSNDDGENDEDRKEMIENSVKKIIHWSCLRSMNEDDEGLCTYRQLELPEDTDVLYVEVIAVLSATELVLNLVEPIVDPSLIESKNGFTHMTGWMKDDACLYPSLKKPFKYKMCCAKFSADDTWYRAFVLEEIDEEEERVLIQYVDYGNCEIVEASKLHTIADEWTKPEVQSILCTLHNISANKTVPLKEIMTKVSECLSQKVLKAKIISRSLVNVIELYCEDGDALAYQPLVDEGIFILGN